MTDKHSDSLFDSIEFIISTAPSLRDMSTWTESLVGYSPWVRKESDATEAAEHAYVHCDLVADFTHQIIL